MCRHSTHQTSPVSGSWGSNATTVSPKILFEVQRFYVCHGWLRAIISPLARAPNKPPRDESNLIVIAVHYKRLFILQAIGQFCKKGLITGFKSLHCMRVTSPPRVIFWTMSSLCCVCVWTFENKFSCLLRWRFQRGSGSEIRRIRLERRASDSSVEEFSYYLPLNFRERLPLSRDEQCRPPFFRKHVAAAHADCWPSTFREIRTSYTV